MTTPSTFNLNLSESHMVNIAITDVNGRTIREVLNESMSAGKHTIALDWNGLSAGNYFVMIRTEEENHVLKLKVA